MTTWKPRQNKVAHPELPVPRLEVRVKAYEQKETFVRSKHEVVLIVKTFAREQVSEQVLEASESSRNHYSSEPKERFGKDYGTNICCVAAFLGAHLQLPVYLVDQEGLVSELDKVYYSNQLTNGKQSRTPLAETAVSEQ